jgi:hypothetical protein
MRESFRTTSGVFADKTRTTGQKTPAWKVQTGVWFAFKRASLEVLQSARTSVAQPAGPVRTWNLIIEAAVAIAIGLVATDLVTFGLPLIKRVAAHSTGGTACDCAYGCTSACVTVADVVADDCTCQRANGSACPCVAFDIASGGAATDEKGKGREFEGKVIHGSVQFSCGEKILVGHIGLKP